MPGPQLEEDESEPVDEVAAGVAAEVAAGEADGVSAETTMGPKNIAPAARPASAVPAMPVATTTLRIDCSFAGFVR
jgi:hypothetical protein